MSARSSSWNPETDTKSSWPPIPEYCREPSESAATCPSRSTSSAPLIVTMSRFSAMSMGVFTASTGRNRTSALPSSHS